MTKQTAYKEFYTDIADRYHGSRYQTTYGRTFAALHHQALRSLLQGESWQGPVLEVACGTGHTTALLDEMGLNFYACDLTFAMMQQAQQRVGGKGRFAEADALSLPYRDNTFEMVISTRFLHLFPLEKQLKVLQELTRVLKPAGTLVVDFDNFTSRWLLAIPYLIYNLLRYRRISSYSNYNRIPQVEKIFAALGCSHIRSVGVGGYHLIIPAAFSVRHAIRLGAVHYDPPYRFLAEQFIVRGQKRA